MPIMDKTGRNLHEGHLVDVQMNGMFTGMVIKVEDNVVQQIGQPPRPKLAVIQIVIPVPVDQRNMVHNVYIVGHAPKEVKEQMETAKKAVSLN
jgi:hypothetical protein